MRETSTGITGDQTATFIVASTIVSPAVDLESSLHRKSIDLDTVCTRNDCI